MISLPVASPNIHYAMPLKEDPAATRRLDRMLKRAFNMPQLIKPDCYEHFYSFPNLTIGHVNGRHFSFFQYTPISPTRTRLRVRVWMPSSHESSEIIKDFCMQYEAGARPFVKTVSDEDKSICELVQRGVASKPKGAMENFIDKEELIVQFQSNYRNIMRG
jgi:phenylpropionate dioxygenase-like ring-hydroxylating dioxygenase large terminal subunit